MWPSSQTQKGLPTAMLEVVRITTASMSISKNLLGCNWLDALSKTSIADEPCHFLVRLTGIRISACLLSSIIVLVVNEVIFRVIIQDAK